MSDYLHDTPTPPPARGDEETCKCDDSFGEEAMCWVCVSDLESRLTATEARLAAETRRADAAVAIAREWDADFQRFVSEGCNVSAVKDRRSRLDQIGGEDGK